MKSLMLRAGLAAALIEAPVAGAQAGQSGQTWAPRLPFTMTLSNNTPLAFGMGVEETALALHGPLQYVRGRPGNEIFLAFRNIGGSGLVPHRHRLFLQFRHGRLTGWKGDWGENWMWE